MYCWSKHAAGQKVICLIKTAAGDHYNSDALPRRLWSLYWPCLRICNAVCLMASGRIVRMDSTTGRQMAQKMGYDIWIKRMADGVHRICRRSCIHSFWMNISLDRIQRIRHLEVFVYAIGTAELVNAQMPQKNSRQTDRPYTLIILCEMKLFGSPVTNYTNNCDLINITLFFCGRHTCCVKTA